MNESTHGAFRRAVNTEIDGACCGVVSNCTELADVDMNESTHGAFRGAFNRKSTGLIVASSPIVKILLVSI